ncbi:MAG TPA: tetratricopeptide repeat protein [Gemmataceae bacterium]|nr:tetratricopeptide repeat protein [Gemmataceae bacterium]
MLMLSHLLFRARLAIALGILCLGAHFASAQVTPEQQAQMLLNSARKAYNDKNHAFAAGKFREFLQKFGNHKEAAAARYGLALALLEGPDKKYDEARDLMQGLAASKEFPDRALANYYAGIAARSQGLTDLAQADAKPNEAVNLRNRAQTRFNEAIPFLTTAVTALLSKVENPLDKDKLTLEAEWVARARCDLAELQLRVGKLKEAQASAAPFVADPLWSKSQYRNLGRYFHGYASILLKDNATAQKTLSLLTPFDDPGFGTHARYLLARTHHLADERAEATTHYEGTLADYAKEKAAAVKYLQTPTTKNEPELRARMEALARNPAPDHVARTTFYLAVLHYEGGKFGDAKTRFAEFVKTFPQSSLKTEAEVRIGYCQVQLREYADAVKTLTPLVEKEARLSDQVLFWLGKAQVGLAPDATANLQAHNQAIVNAINTFRSAADRAQRIVAQDPEAKARRGEIQLEMADQMQHIWQNKEAANIYSQLLNEKVLPERDEEIMQRWTNALNLAGDYTESDKACVKFQERFPQSSLLAPVLFVYAENSYFRVLAAEKANQAKELPPLYAETIKRFQTVITKFPEYPKINTARYSLGLAFYRQGDLKNALTTLKDIPGPERGGDITLTSFLIADCIMRQVPNIVPDDALAAGKMEEQLKSAAENLESFIGSAAKDPNVPDALVKLGLCQQRLASLAADPKEKARLYTVARDTYDRARKDFGKDNLINAQATFERAKCVANIGDINQGINELRRFTADPFRQTPVAPQAVLQLATYLRAQNKPADAVDVLAKNRDVLEGILNKDPAKAKPMIAKLRYHHGIALREAGKLPEARAQFDSAIKLDAKLPEATESALRIGQCLKEEGLQRLEAAQKLQYAAKTPDQRGKAKAMTDEGYKFVRDSAAYLETHADQIKQTPALEGTRARMLYDAAWGARILSEPEVAAARLALQQEAAKKLNATSAKFPLPEVAIDKVPLQPSEKRARGLYKLLIDQVGDTAIATEARFELAELLAERNENDAALALFNEVLDKEPGQEMTEKVRLRLGGVFAAKGNLKGALQQFDAVASNPKSPLVGWAQYRAAEALIQNQQYPDAIKRLTIFRDQGQWQNIAGLSDRALLRLGYAYAIDKSWEPSRVAYERVVNAFPNSTYVDDARYGMAWAMQQQKNHEGAANVYAQIVSRTATELAAKAQLQIGLCRMEQKRYADAVNAFLVIPTTYDYGELRAAALFEAGKAYLELKQAPQANQQFERILREFPNTPWAEAAKEKIGKK